VNILVIDTLGKLNSRVFAAPMAATTNTPFRKLCREYGAALTTSEMINSDALVKGCTNTLRRIFFDPEEHPLSLQLFGHDPYIMADAAKILMKIKPDFIDINAGCPVQKINNLGAGAALLNNLKKLGEIVRAVVDAVDIPVTVKIRTGYTKKKIIACEAARVIEANGASFITVHARTRQTSYLEKPNWEWIKMVKNCVKIPVVGNGDVFQPQDAYEMLDRTNCDFVLIARGALGNPWIFKRAIHFIEKKEILPEPDHEEKLKIILKHIEITFRSQGEINGMKEMHKHLCWYTRGYPESEQFRHELFKSRNHNDLKNLITCYFEKLMKGELKNGSNYELEDRKFKERVVFWLVNADPSEIVYG
jgi:nifR3 family TIM-barrel protein